MGLTATFFSRFAAYVFVTFGGLSLFIGTLLQSYALWPVNSFTPVLKFHQDLIFVTRFSDLMSMMLLIAAPVIVVLSLVEFGFGLVNRYAERLNVFSLSLALKAWLAVLVIALILVALVDHVLGWIAGQHNLLDMLGRTIFPAA